MKRTLIVLALLSAVALTTGCDPSDDGVECPEGPVFTHHVVAPDSVANIDPLGNLNPPGHVFPSDHGGYYIKAEPGAMATYNVQIFAPGKVKITSMVASEHVTAALTDFELNFELCDDLWGRFGHITTLNADLFGATADYTQWHLEDEYSTGGETYRRWTKSMNMTVEGGDLLGTTGGNPGQGGLDFGMYDRRIDAQTAANPARWSNYGYLHARHFIDLYEDGAVRNELLALVNREDIPNDPHPTGYNMQDVPGTAHGVWFHPGSPNNPEDPHLALVWSHIRPSKLTFSVGTSVPDIGDGVYEFSPEDDGVFNRLFTDVTADGLTYGYVPVWPLKTLFIRMPDADTIWIEILDGVHEDPADWVFTDAKVVFVR